MKRGIHHESDGWLLCYDGFALEGQVFPTLAAAQLAWRQENRREYPAYRDAATATGMYDHDDSN